LNVFDPFCCCFYTFEQSNLGEQIWKAIKTGNKEEFARLLNGGVDPNVFSYEGRVRIVWNILHELLSFC
jgi:hypothetical protein